MIRRGTPAGTNGRTAMATTAAASAIASGSRARNRGASRARNAAGGAASSPSTRGFENACAASANCEAPVNSSTDSAHVWSTDNPAALEIAPNEIAYAPLAIAMPRASRTIPFRGSADLVAVRSDDVPGGAEVVDALSGGISGIVIGDDVVKRVTAICDLNRPVVTLGRPEQRGVDPGARLRG